MGVSENRGTPKSSILIEVSIINHPFWGIPIFGNTQICLECSEWFVFRDGMDLLGRKKSISGWGGPDLTGGFVVYFEDFKS